MLFDTHAHIDDNRFKGETEQVIARAKEQGVSLLVNVGYDLLHARQSIELAEKYPFIYASVGLHPHDAKEADNVFWQEIYKLARHPKVVAIGEIGLDYYYDHSPRDVQRRFSAGKSK